MGVHWYVVKSGREDGPLTWGELRDLAAAGRIGPDDRVRPDGSGEARRAADVPGLYPALFSDQPASENPPDPPRFFLCYPGGPTEPEGPFTPDELRARVPADRAAVALVNPVGTGEWRRLDEVAGLSPRSESTRAAPETPAPAGSAADGRGESRDWMFKVTSALAAAIPVLAVWAYRRAFYAGAGWDAGDLIGQVGALLCVGAVVAAVVFWVAKGTRYVLKRRPGLTGHEWLQRPDRLAVAGGSIIGLVIAAGWVTLNHRTLSEKRDLQASEVYRAVRLQGQGDHAKAIQGLGNALADFPPSADVYLLRAQSHLAVGDPDKALTDLDEAVRLRPADSLGYGLRAMAHEKKGDSAAARRDRERSDQLSRAAK
jgi:hypothetical protein